MKPLPQRNDRVTLLRLNEPDVNDYGEPILGAWESIGERWAYVATKANIREFWNGTENINEATHLIQMVNDSLTRTLSVKDQISVDGTPLRILMAYDPNRDRQHMFALCRETLGDIVTGEDE